MGQLRKIESKLISLGYQIVVISPDRPEKIKELNAKASYDYTLLSDSDLAAARALGIAFHVDDKMFETLKNTTWISRTRQARRIICFPSRRSSSSTPRA